MLVIVAELLPLPDTDDVVEGVFVTVPVWLLDPVTDGLPDRLGDVEDVRLTVLLLVDVLEPVPETVETGLVDWDTDAETVIVGFAEIVTDFVVVPLLETVSELVELAVELAVEVDVAVAELVDVLDTVLVLVVLLDAVLELVADPVAVEEAVAVLVAVLVDVCVFVVLGVGVCVAVLDGVPVCVGVCVGVFEGVPVPVCVDV